MRIYIGGQTPSRIYVYVGDDDGPMGLQPLDSRSDLRNHSPCGPNWGYGGSGPTQLALALAADALDDDAAALAVYQRLKVRLVVGLPQRGFVLTKDQVLDAIKECQSEKPGPRNPSTVDGYDF